MRVLQVNARSLRNKINEFKALLSIKHYDIVAVTETWFNFKTRDLVGEFDIAGYQLFSKERCGKMGGGVALYVKDSTIAVTTIEVNLPREIDGLCVKIRMHRTSYIVSCIYRPPNITEQVDLQLYESLGSTISGKQAIILGDFNCANVDYENMTGNAEGERLINFLEDNFLNQTVKCPTRGANILDLVITTDESLVNNIQVLEPLADSDHNMVEFDFAVDGKKDKNEMRRPNFNKANFSEFKNKLSRVNWNEEFRDVKANDMWETFMNKFKNANENCVPYSSKFNDKNIKPLWFKRDIENLIKNRNRAYKLHKRFINDIPLRNNYHNIRREVKKEIRKSKRQYEIDIARDSKKNPKRFFQYVNNRKPIKNTIGPLTNEEGEIICDSKDMAVILNNFFSSVFINETKNDIPNAIDVVHFDANNTLSDILFTPAEVSSQIAKIKISKAPGPDGIYPKHLIELKDSIVEPLTKIFNASISEGKIPVDFKIANVTPIFKKGDKSAAENYRPISLTSIVGKLMESVIKDHIINHLESHNLIRNSQHGFRSNRSCLTNLLEFFHEIYGLYENSRSVDIIYLDFRKAFDTVPHSRLLEKLRAHGIRGSVLNWIEEWLRARKQRVVIDGESSDWVSVTSGVPQGSVLGPLLFIIYVNDLDINLASTLSKFADDTKIGGKVETIEDKIKIQADLDKIAEWSLKWKMDFNVDKCNVLHIGSKNVNFQYTMLGKVLNSVNEQKDLGVIVSNNFKVEKQSSIAVGKANRMLSFISRNFHYKSRDIVLPLYKSLVRPHLEYAIQFWCPYMRKDIEKLERVQRRVTKLIPSIRHKNYEQRLEIANIPSLETRRLRGDLIQVFKILNRFDNVCASNYFEISQESRTRNNGFKLSGRKFSTSAAKNYFTYRTVNKWNELPANVVESTSVNMFKNRLDKYFRARGIV